MMRQESDGNRELLRDVVSRTLTARLFLALLALAMATAACGGGQSAPASEGGEPVDMIAFEDDKGIAAVSPEGGKVIRISDVKGPVGPVGFFRERRYDWAPAWSPLGDRIAFLSQRDGNVEVYVANADGSHQKNLTSHSAGDWAFGFAWSPDGTRIAFASEGDGRDLWVVNIDGTGLANLTGRHGVHPAGWSIRPTQQLSWSPDGSRIAFSSAPRGTAQQVISPGGISVVTADGARLTNLTNGMELAPSWSPDGTRIAYLAGAGELHVMQADGSADTWIVGGAEVNDFVWSPGGKRIAFSAPGGHVSAVNADGSCRTQLTDEGDEYWGESPGWSPDGRRIAFASNRPGQVGLYVMNDDGSAQARRADRSSAGSVTWSPGQGAVSADREIECSGRSGPSQAAGPPEGYTEQLSYSGDCRKRPAGSVCIGYADGYIWLTYAGIKGWDTKPAAWQGRDIQVALADNGDYFHILGTRYVKKVPY